MINDQVRRVKEKNPDLRGSLVLSGVFGENDRAGSGRSGVSSNGTGRADIPGTCGSREFEPTPNKDRVLTGNVRPGDLKDHTGTFPRPLPYYKRPGSPHILAGRFTTFQIVP